MYLQYYGLAEPPFSITPDPRFVFLGRQHEDGLAHLRYGISQGGGGGFVQLTGEVGTGKTTLSRLLLEDLPADAEAALVLNPLLAPGELLETICQEFGIDVTGAEGSIKALTDRLNAHLLEIHGEGRVAVVVIDEAQNLSPAALEQVRLLTNLETHRQKLLQIILLGQPELRQLLARADLRQLAQRITARFHLKPLDAEETGSYIAHRLQVAGASANPFTAAAVKRLHGLTGGVPRLINIVADRSLLAGYAGGAGVITPALVKRADAEVRGEDGRQARRRAPAWAIAAATMVLAAGLGYVFLGGGAADGRGKRGVPAGADGGFAPAERAAPVSGVEASEPVATGAAAVPSPDLPGASRGEAMDALLELRGIDRPPGVAPGVCPWSLDAGVFCLDQRGRLEDLRALDRPVVALLPTGHGVVRPLADGGLEWLAGGQRRRLSGADFERLWSGRYIDVWRMPAFAAEVLREGDRGPAVLWVKAAAARAEPAFAGDVGDPYFGPALRRWATEFQQAAGLRSDGLVGPETLQRLSRYAAVEPVPGRAPEPGSS